MRRNKVCRNNTLRNNGLNPDLRVARYGVPEVDLLWDMSGARQRMEPAWCQEFSPAVAPD